MKIKFLQDLYARYLQYRINATEEGLALERELYITLNNEGNESPEMLDDVRKGIASLARKKEMIASKLKSLETA
ncbi:MAG TPA: hypothetical protein VMC07_02520 [Candidatus Omnitrophota bacterium]|nr:hypothetical protein [Candidatus Omnitrophota bacterium]